MMLCPFPRVCLALNGYCHSRTAHTREHNSNNSHDQRWPMSAGSTLGRVHAPRLGSGRCLPPLMIDNEVYCGLNGWGLKPLGTPGAQQCRSILYTVTNPAGKHVLIQYIQIPPTKFSKSQINIPQQDPNTTVRNGETNLL